MKITQSMKEGFVIAIDGPVASGKGTIAQQLARRLTGFDLYTGATYRALALFCIEHQIAVSESEVALAAEQITIALQDSQILLNGKDVTQRIAEKDVASMSSKIATFPAVRRILVTKQQEIAQQFLQKGQIVVAEGRDTGTVVFPKAAVKLYLTASVETRANRRMQQYHAQGDMRSFEEVFEEIRNRDIRDITRQADPLVSNPEKDGYIVLDNSDMTEEQTLAIIEQELQQRNLL